MWKKRVKSWLKLIIQKTKIMASGPITSWPIDGETVETGRFYFCGLQYNCSHEIKRCLLLGRNTLTNLDSILKSRHYFANKGPSSQTYHFSSNHVWMWELDCKESWALKNRCFWTMVLKNTLEDLLDCKEIQPVSPKGNQYWIFIGRTDAEAETTILWPPDAKNWLIGKDPDAGKDWRQERRWWQKMRWFDGITDSTDMSLSKLWGRDGQESLVSCNPWGYKESDMTKWLNWTDSKNLHIMPIYELG